MASTSTTASRRKVTTYGKASRSKSPAFALAEHAAAAAAVAPSQSSVSRLKRRGDAVRPGPGDERDQRRQRTEGRPAGPSAVPADIWDLPDLPAKRKSSHADPVSRPIKKQRSLSPGSSPLVQAPAKAEASAAAKRAYFPTTPAPRCHHTGRSRCRILVDQCPARANCQLQEDSRHRSAERTIPTLHETHNETRNEPRNETPSSQLEGAHRRCAAAQEGTRVPDASTTRPPPRRRLIDALATQEEHSSEEESEPDHGDPQTSPDPSQSSVGEAVAAVDRSSPNPMSPPQNRVAAPGRQVLTKKAGGVKFTYTQQRTVLAENPLASLAASGSHLSVAEPLFQASQSTLAVFALDEAEIESAAGAIRSVHELRQAGANNRFADELDDILDRVGLPSPAKPSSARRGALVDVACKLHDRGFLRQFQSHCDGTVLFKKVADENDVIAGYALACILVTLLSASSSSHLVQQAQAQGISHMLARLLANDSDIAVVSRDRKSNVSRHSQTLLSTLKSAVLGLAIWEAPQTAPSQLSPRTLALKCLERLVKHPRSPADLGDPVSAAATAQLFGILSSASRSPDSASWDFPSAVEAADLYLALSVLEVYSVHAMQSAPDPTWMSQYLPITADVLQTVLRHRSDRFGDVECLVLKLVLNTTNHNPDAQMAFIGRQLLGDLAGLACGRFDAALQSIAASAGFAPAVLDSLVLMLGLLINFCEHNLPACQTMAQTAGGASLDRLIQIFRDNHSTTAEVRKKKAAPPLTPNPAVAGAWLTFLFITGRHGREDDDECCVWVPLRAPRLPLSVEAHQREVRRHGAACEVRPGVPRRQRGGRLRSHGRRPALQLHQRAAEPGRAAAEHLLRALSSTLHVKSLLAGLVS